LVVASDPDVLRDPYSEFSLTIADGRSVSSDAKVEGEVEENVEDTIRQL
jgi:hypothetical protein